MWSIDITTLDDATQPIYIVWVMSSRNPDLGVVPYYTGYKAMALYPIQGHPLPYNAYKAIIKSGQAPFFIWKGG